MDSHTFHNMWELISVIEAQELLNSIVVSSFPDTKSDDQKKILTNYKKQAYPTEVGQTRALSNSELMAALGVRKNNNE